MFKSFTLLSTVASLVLAGSAHADLISWVDVKAHNESGGGGISSLSDDNPQAATFTKGDPNDPATWTASGQAWQDDWQGNNPLDKGATGKFGWVTFNFGSVQPLDEVYIWNVSEATAQNRRVIDYNIWYANSPTVAPASGSPADYDFTSGGWTQLGGTKTLLQWQSGTGADGSGTNGEENLGVSAQYVGLEFLTYGGGTRIGLNEVVFTTSVIPEPSSLALIGLGALLLARRRRG